MVPPFLTSAQDGGRWSASRPYSFTHGDRAPGTHWIEGFVGPRIGLDFEVKKIILPLSPWNFNVQPVARCCTDWAITAHDKGNVPNSNTNGKKTQFVMSCFSTKTHRFKSLPRIILKRFKPKSASKTFWRHPSLPHRKRSWWLSWTPESTTPHTILSYV
jgi:hypothetical protein